jgi:CRP-like cAMP-binding protein
MMESRDEQANERNRLLRALPGAEYARLVPRLERITVEALEVLAEAGQPLGHVYFPETAIISVVRRMSDGTVIEAGTIGREGMAGIAVLAGEDWSSATILGEVPGACKRMAFDVLHRVLPELPRLDALLRRFVLTFVNQVGQTAACNGRHAIDQRCARWLLMTHDQVGADDFLLTHEVLAQMLAVRRASVTVAAGALQRAGVIRYHRGRITILDRSGLEAVACECYSAVRANFDRLLGGAAPVEI